MPPTVSARSRSELGLAQPSARLPKSRTAETCSVPFAHCSMAARCSSEILGDGALAMRLHVRQANRLRGFSGRRDFRFIRGNLFTVTTERLARLARADRRIRLLLVEFAPADEDGANELVYMLKMQPTRRFWRE